MHLLVCPSCGRRYAVTGARSLDEGQCTKCSQDLVVIDRDLERLTVMGDVRPTQGALNSPTGSRRRAGRHWNATGPSHSAVASPAGARLEFGKQERIGGRRGGNAST